MKQKGNNGYLLVFFAGVLWGTIGLFVKQLQRCGASPMETAFLRVFFAFLMMLALCVFHSGWRSLKTDKRTTGVCILLGVVCHGVYNIFYSFAVTMAGVSVSAVLLNIAPVFTLLCSGLCFGERITKRKLIAIAVNILGCVLTVTNGKLNTASFSLPGILCGVGAGLCYAMTAVIGRFAADRTNPYVMSMYSYLSAAILLFVWMQPWAQTHTISENALIWSSLYALIPTAIAYILYYKGLQKIRESSKVPVIASVETVVAALVGILLYHERLGVIGSVGVLLVLFSILLMNKKEKHIGDTTEGFTLH